MPGDDSSPRLRRTRGIEDYSVGIRADSLSVILTFVLKSFAANSPADIDSNSEIGSHCFSQKRRIKLSEASAISNVTTESRKIYKLFKKS